MSRHFRFVLFPLVALVALATFSATAGAHCQVPCGIYTDQLRFEAFLEDQATIAKAMNQIHELAGKDDAQSANQLARWVATKEDHATKIQNVVAQYFLAQRIKSSNERYSQQLVAAHGLIVAAMKCKQTVDPANAAKLKEAIYNLYRAYEGKEPDLEDDDEDEG